MIVQNPLIITGFLFTFVSACSDSETVVEQEENTNDVVQSIVSEDPASTPTDTLGIEITQLPVEPNTSEKEELNLDPIFIGQWNKEDSQNPIDPTSFYIMKKDENGYSIKFGNEDYFISASLNSNVIKGTNNSGNFVIELISEEPLIISYSDDGRGHFEPVRNERFIKIRQ